MKESGRRQSNTSAPSAPAAVIEPAVSTNNNTCDNNHGTITTHEPDHQGPVEGAAVELLSTIINVRVGQKDDVFGATSNVVETIVPEGRGDLEAASDISTAGARPHDDVIDRECRSDRYEPDDVIDRASRRAERVGVPCATHSAEQMHLITPGRQHTKCYGGRQ